MNEQTIQYMSISDMIKDSVISDIQAEPQDHREILKAAFFQRLAELNASKQVIEQVKKAFKTLDKVDKELADEYTRQNAIENSEIPLKFDEWKRLDDNKRLYAPKTPGEEWPPLFVEALQKLSYQEYLLDEAEERRAKQ